MFGSVPVLVFANFLPEEDRLSKDRWEIIDLRDGSIDLSEEKTYSPEEEKKFWKPEEVPTFDKENVPPSKIPSLEL